MGTLSQICLRWNNHQSNFTSVFDKLYVNSEFVDCTLTCEGQSVKAHKIVLSACSPYFHMLFLENPCKHPIIFMKDVKYMDLHSIVEYIYKGEVRVDRDQLQDFLRTAQSLQIKGLSADDGENVPQSNSVCESQDNATFHSNNSRFSNESSYTPSSYNQSTQHHHSTAAASSAAASKHVPSGVKPYARSSSSNQVPAKMPRLSAAPWRERPRKSPSSPASKRTEVPEPTTETSHKSPQEQEVSEIDSSVEKEKGRAGELDRGEGRSVDSGEISITVPDEDDPVIVKSEGGQDSPIVEDDHVPYEHYSRDTALLGDMEASVGLSDASDGGDLGLDAQDGGATFTSGPGTSQGGSSTVDEVGSTRAQWSVRSRMWTMATMERALEAVVGGMSVTKAAIYFDIPRRTLYRYYRSMKQSYSTNLENPELPPPE